MEPIFAKVWEACERGGHTGRTVTVKVKHSDFHQITRSRSGTDPIGSLAELQQISLDLLRPCFPPPRGVRLLGVTMSGFDTVPKRPLSQLALLLDQPGAIQRDP